MKFYKIKAPDGSFKEGGTYSFGKFGKLWRKGTFKQHLAQYNSFKRYYKLSALWECIKHAFLRGDAQDADDCVVVEYELVPVKEQPLYDYVKENMEKYK